MQTLEVLKSWIVPSPVQMAISLLLSFVILIGTHIKLFSALIANSAYVPEGDLAQVISNYLVHVSQFQYAEKLSVGIFWAVMASVVYIIAVIANNALIEVRNEFVIDTEFTNDEGHRVYWIKSTVVRLVWVILLVGLVYLTLTQLLPLWLYWFSQPFITGSIMDWWQSAVVVVGLAANVYAVWALLNGIRAVELA